MVDAQVTVNLAPRPEQDGHEVMKPSATAIDSHSVMNCFLLFLGRQPDHTILSTLQQMSLPALLAWILESDQFHQEVLRPVLLHEALPQERIEDKPPVPLIDWIQKCLPVAEVTRRVAPIAPGWGNLLELLLADAELTQLSPSLAGAEIDQLLRVRLEGESWAKVKHAVAGCIDSASGFEVRGWALDLCNKAEPVSLEFYADNLFLGSILCDEPRPDVVDVVGGDGLCGFTFRISAAHRMSFGTGRALIAIDPVSRTRIGGTLTVYADAAQQWDMIRAASREIVQVREVLERIESRLPEMGRLASLPIEAYGEYWERFYRLAPELLEEQRQRGARFTYQPLISIVIPTWNSDTRLLLKAIDSVRAQTWEQWELIVTDDASERDELRLLRRRTSDDLRIRWIDSSVRGGIAANTNRGLEAARGDYVAFLDHDDELSPDALFQVVSCLQRHLYALLYSDEDRIEETEQGRCLHHTPFFKSDFDPDLLRSINYICHLTVLRRDIVEAVGGLRAGFEGAQDHDLLLRVTARLNPEEVFHVPRVLYHWRVTPGSVSRTPEIAETIQQNIVNAVNDQLLTLELAARAEVHSDPAGASRQFATRIRWSLPKVTPLVSIIIATRDRVDLLRPCMTSVLNSMGEYPGDYEILIADNESVEPETLSYFDDLAKNSEIRFVRFRGPFNWSAINNAAALEARGDVLIFLNNDTLVISRDWCGEMVAQAMRPDVGAVGARLLYADGTLQHGGVVLGVDGVAGHEGIGESPAQGGYFGRCHLLRSAAAVTGACMATRRELFVDRFDAGFDDLNLKVAFNDIDYCMKVREAGYRVIYNPYATLYHLESKSRGRDWSDSQRARHRQETKYFLSRWQGKAMEDPYYNPHFERFARPFERLKPPPALMLENPEDS